MKLHRYVDHQRLHIVTKDVISLSISVLLLFRHYISHKITFGAPSSGGVLRSACGAFILSFICENSHNTNFGIKILEIDFVTEIFIMIFDLLTSPQGHQFEARVKILLAFCSTRHPCQFDMQHDHVRKNIFFDPPLGISSAPKSHTWGMTQVLEQKSC